MRLTIFTPTYNRAHLLERLFNSLKEQEYFDFEWIVIDDDSSDNTEETIQAFQKEAPFPIVFLKQPHGGKHRAINKALKIAKGDYFYIVDSDDWLKADALKNIYNWIDETKNNTELCGFAGLIFSNNKIVGGAPKISNAGYIDASNLERDKYNLGGDKSEIYKTSILKKFPFPEFDNEFFITEAVCWDAIAYEGYKIRWYNVPIYCCEYLEDGLSKSGANDLPGYINNYNGFGYYISQCIRINGLEGNYKKLFNFFKASIFLKKNINDIASALSLSKAKLLLLFVIIPFSFAKSKILKICKRRSNL